MSAVADVDAALPADLQIELRLWCVDLDAAATAVADLPDAVQQRAGRFVHEVDRRRYLASQAAVRRLLGSSSAWREGAHGKPALAVPPPHFNASRRERWGLVGRSQTHEVGVDIESLREIDDARELAALHFTPREREQVTDSAAFLRVWTRKEACMKATGLGLSLPPSSFECGAHAVAQHVQVRTPQRHWQLLVQTPPLDVPAVGSWAVVLA